VLAVSEIAALPKGRAVVFASGTPATLMRMLPWIGGAHADAVPASIADDDPVATATIAAAMDSQAVADQVGVSG
jgi:hypothetical protein